MSRSGFSLVEVTLAIGLVAFAIVVIFSLMSVGLATLQEANRQIVETEIFNTVGSELSSTPFDQLSTYCSARFPVYFDNEGVETTSVPNRVFTARYEIAAPEGAGELRRITVSVGYQHDPTETGYKPTKRTFLIANRGL
ncbi:MAG: Verru_Chthon cassette protein B [Candidatus Methylacidiphilales bacterium]